MDAVGGLVGDRVDATTRTAHLRFTHEWLGLPAARQSVLGAAFPVVGAIGGRGRRVTSDPIVSGDLTDGVHQRLIAIVRGRLVQLAVGRLSGLIL